MILLKSFPFVKLQKFIDVVIKIYIYVKDYIFTSFVQIFNFS